MWGLDANDIAEQLAARAEAVCHKYLCAGRKEGAYWLVGDVRGKAGRSLFVRLKGPLSGKGAAGRWTDAATNEYGNLLDVIRESCGFVEFREVLAEATRFLNLSDTIPLAQKIRTKSKGFYGNTRIGALRLLEASKPIKGTLAQTYLKSRGIVIDRDFDALRFHPCCYYRLDDNAKPELWPALIGRVSDLDGVVTGITRTWLARDGSDKAPVETQRRSKGDLIGHGIRFGRVDDVLAVGEGLETTLSLRRVMPFLPVMVATSSSHLSAIAFAPTLRTLIVICDNDTAGNVAAKALILRGHAAGLYVVLIVLELDDLNTDLMTLGLDRLRDRILHQLPADIIERFMV